jgi:hypothetical protein
MWDLRLADWHWDNYFTQYFSSPLSTASPFCTMLIHLSVIDAMQPCEVTTECNDNLTRATVNWLLRNVRILASAGLCFHMVTILSVSATDDTLNGQQGQETENVRIKSASCFSCALSSYKVKLQLLWNRIYKNVYWVLRSVTQWYVWKPSHRYR